MYNYREHYREQIKCFIKTTYVELTNQNQVNDVLLKVYNNKITPNEIVMYTIRSFIKDENLRNYFNIAWKYIQNCHYTRKLKNEMRKKRKDNENITTLTDFDKAYTSFTFYKTYIAESEIEAIILENKWLHKVKPSTLVKYKNPTIYHIPMGGINKH